VKLSDLPPAQIVRFHQRILTKIHRWGEGGGMFGVDLHTLHQCRPGLAKAYSEVREELKKRRREALPK
jgi:hypothetical protein